MNQNDFDNHINLSKNKSHFDSHSNRNTPHQDYKRLNED